LAVGSLKSVVAARNRIESVSFGRACESLLLLDLSGNRLGSLAFLGGLPNLKSLNVSHYGLRDAGSAPRLRGLMALVCAGNDLRAVAGSAFPRVSRLHLRCNRLSDISSLFGFLALSDADVSGNPIGDDHSSVRGSIPSLKRLVLSETEISRIGFLQSPSRISSRRSSGRRSSGTSAMSSRLFHGHRL